MIDTNEPSYLKDLVENYKNSNKSLKFLDKIMNIEKIEYSDDMNN